MCLFIYITTINENEGHGFEKEKGGYKGDFGGREGKRRVM